MRRELSSAYRTVENKAQIALEECYPFHYYTKETPLNTLGVHAAIKIIIFQARYP
ncbi:MAG TPA: hypothetical protein VEF35_05870 [Candidatus Bathyarchaeia archaeon]|nr:hypothetical protein [Candidatus Bathyarchaeia archaeon]